MAADRPEGTGSRFTKRQLLVAGGVVLVIVIVIWQVMGLMGSDSNAPTPTITQTANTKPAAPMSNQQPQQMAAAAPPVIPAGMAPANQALPPPPRQPAAAIQGNPQSQQAAVREAKLKEQQDQQDKYLATINQLEMLKLQRDIAETNQAISAANLATATADKNIHDLMKPPTAPGPVPAGDYAKGLVAPGTQPIDTSQAPAPIAMEPAMVNYVVISVSMQFNKWSAVLGNSGKLYNVSVGDVLPLDGSTVISINKSGVVLRTNGMKRKISLVPVI